MNFSQKQYAFSIMAVISFIIFSYFYLDRPIAEYFLANASTYESFGDFLSLFGESNWYFATAIIGFVIFKFIKKMNSMLSVFYFYYTSIFFLVYSV